MTRRGFLRGLVGLAVASKLPKADAASLDRPPTVPYRPSQRELCTPSDSNQKNWEMLIYGVPMVYTAGLIRRDVQ